MRGSRGFSLVEVLVSLAVLGLALLLVAPSFQSILARRQLQGTADEAAVLLRRARYDAIRLGRRAAVAWDPAAGFFFDADLDGAFEPVEAQGGVVRLPRRVIAEGPAADPAAADGLSVLGTAPAAVFEPTGAVVAAGAFRLADRRGNHLEVRVLDSPAAPAVIRKWDGAAWRRQGEGGTRWEWH